MPSITYLFDSVTSYTPGFSRTLLYEVELLAVQAWFIRRPGKFTGTTFAQTLVLGYRHKPDATRPEFASYAADIGTLAAAPKCGT